MAGDADEPARLMVLKGPSAARLTAAGRLFNPFAVLCLIPITFESKLGSAEPMWAGSWLMLCFLLIAGGLWTLLHGFRKSVSEVAAGYTTLPTVYAANRDLYLLDPVTHGVLLEPTLPWKSQTTGRLVAGMRGERRFASDETVAGEARARQDVRRTALAQGRRAIGYPPIRRGIVIAALIAPLAVVAVGVGVRIHPEQARSQHPRTGATESAVSLQHTTVEKQIEVFYQGSDVVCNGNHDIAVTTVGQTFACTAADGTHYTVTITDARTGKFTVN